ncbi:hypothetical protein FALBO_5845 [Fusarium albosuccineum]|uniref:Mif2/CENP-C cupin domain-containing protein n=1 Tax=Fusarium albosuccineum TaxID=1237068 RepID=A0A8H4PF59_9HYPO|nr:hypothetical protein FALBO_5845 [Fusarium albosuccineum]
MSPLDNAYNLHVEPNSWYLGVRGRKTGIQLPSIRERDEYGMEPLGTFFSSPDRAISAATRNGDPESSQDDGNERARAGCVREEIGNESDPLLFREPGAPMVHFAEPSPLQLQPILPAQMELAVVCLSSTPERHGAIENSLERYDTEPFANVKGFFQEMSGNEDAEEDIGECQDSQHGDTGADALQHLEEASPDHSRTSSQQPEDAEPERPTSSPTIQNHDEGTTETLLQQAHRGSAPPRRRGRPKNTAPSQSKGPEAGTNPPKRQFQTLSSASPELSGDECRSEEAGCARERKRPCEMATRIPNTPHLAQTAPALAQGPRTGGRPRGRPKKGFRFGGKCTRQRKAKTVVRPEGHTYTTRSGRVCNTPIHDWRGDIVVKEYESVPDATGRGQIVLPTITEVVRAPAEGASSTKGQRGGHRRKPTAKRPRSMANTERELWEERGTFSASCKVWQADSESDGPGAGGSMYANQQVAFTSEEILNRFPARPNFHFGRIDTATSMSFGMLHLPCGQTKEAKNTRGSEQAFFLHSGKVCVELEQQSFRISQGSTWVVPRVTVTGNQYSIINDYRKDARIFFCLSSET